MVSTQTRGRRRGAVEHNYQSTRAEVRAVIVMALLIEIQSPRIGNNYRLNIAIFGIFAILLLLFRARHASENFYVAFSGAMGFLSAYCVWCAASAAWSVNPNDALIDSGMLFIIVLIAASYASVPAIVIAEEFVRVAVLLALLSWVMVIAAPTIAVLPDAVWRLNGPMQHSQRLALVMGGALIVLTIISLYHRGPGGGQTRNTVLFFAVLGVTLLATQTRAFTVFTAVVLWFILFGKAKARQRILLLIGMAIAILVAVLNVDQILAAINRDGSNTGTLTGRTVIWEESLILIRDSPFLGNGFSSFYSDLTSGFFESGYIPPHAHNTWINAAFETGIVGAALLTLFMLAVMRYGSISRPSFASALMSFSVLCGLMGLVFGGKVSTLWVVVTLFAAQQVASRVNATGTRLSARPDSGQKSA